MQLVCGCANAQKDFGCGHGYLQSCWLGQFLFYQEIRKMKIDDFAIICLNETTLFLAEGPSLPQIKIVLEYTWSGTGCLPGIPGYWLRAPAQRPAQPNVFTVGAGRRRRPRRADHRAARGVPRCALHFARRWL